jgi:thiol-disulfide isomerase/thioredoxin
MKFQRSIVWMSALGLAALMLAGLPATAAPPGEQLIDQVVKAYKDIQQYDATLRLTMSQTQGRWTSSQQGEFFIALDRPGNRLLIDSPDQLLVADGQTLFYRNPRLPGKHLQIDATAPLTSQWIVQQVPAVVFPSVPTDFAFLLADDPLAFVSQGAAGAPATLPPDPDDPEKRPRIQAALQAGTLTLTIDPRTHLIDKAVVDVNTAALGAPADTTMTYTFDIHVNSLDKPIDPQRFAFDTSNSAASGSMQQMMASGSNAPHPLVGKDTPPLNLPDIDGNDHDLATADADAKVIVLDFWATWCPPCVAAMPELQTVYDWIQLEGKPVAFYAVNQGETVDEVKKFWQDKDLSIPVLMDEQFTAAQAFGVNGIPQTVIISAGKVQQVHVGYRPGIGDRLKEEIEALLAEGAE